MTSLPHFEHHRRHDAIMLRRNMGSATLLNWRLLAALSANAVLWTGLIAGVNLIR